jgi:hypothetical protein
MTPEETFARIKRKVDQQRRNGRVTGYDRALAEAKATALAKLAGDYEVEIQRPVIERVLDLEHVYDDDGRLIRRDPTPRG